MAKAQNKVVAGKYMGSSILKYKDCIKISAGESWFSFEIGKRTAKSYELITEETMKSGTSAILRGAAGTALLGPIGMLAGLSAKNKGIYTIAIQWNPDLNGNDRGKSLIEIDEQAYKLLVKNMF